MPGTLWGIRGINRNIKQSLHLKKVHFQREDTYLILPEQTKDARGEQNSGSFQEAGTAWKLQRSMTCPPRLWLEWGMDKCEKWLIDVLCMLSRSVMSDSLQSMDCSPPGSSVHGDSPGNNTGVGCHALFQGISSWDGTQVSHIVGGLFIAWATRETQLVPVDKKETHQLLNNLISSADGIEPYLDSMR